MQDRFKFRVWKGKENRMVQDVTYLNPLLLDPRIDKENEHNIPMQCTGMKDRNGTLIYEGDIIKSFYFDEDINKINYEYFHVVFDQEMLAFIFKKKGFIDFVTTDMDEEDYEVAGNIYENKELLNDKQH